MVRFSWVKSACAVCALCAITANALPAQTFTTLLSFDNTDGASPVAGLVQATDGNLYGTTSGGGANSCIIAGTDYGCGTVFKITPTGTLTTLHSFDSTDGQFPSARLVQATDGDFYGTTYAGGANEEACYGNCGTVFKITPSGTLTTLYKFCYQSKCTDGAGPYGALVQATDGDLYGTTVAGGASAACTGGCGTVFKITLNGTLTTLHSFDRTDGYQPFSGLVQANDGNFYGTTVGGGDNGSGSVFKITPSGTLTTLYSFCSQSGCTDGYEPNTLVQANDGNFYGTTYSGGANGYGVVFKVTPGGTLTTVYSFCSQNSCTAGFGPFAGLVQATDGNFYGATNSGGANGDGTIFKITPGGTVTTLYNFSPQESGADTTQAMVQETSGEFYGTADMAGPTATMARSSACLWVSARL